MGLRKNTEKLDDYYGRLKDKKADRIKAAHVEKVMRKLRKKEVEILEDLETVAKPSKEERLKGKLKVVRDQIARADWLLTEIGKE